MLLGAKVSAGKELCVGGEVEREDAMSAMLEGMETQSTARWSLLSV